MISLPKRHAASDGFEAARFPALDALPGEGPETRTWSDRLLRTSHADISLRQTTGEKLPILMLHGGGLCKEIFDRQLASGLGEQHRMIAIDWPGHGASGDAFEPNRTYRIEGLADLALEVLERLGIDNAVVVGASLGGRIGLEMIETFPGLIGLMLTGTPLAAPESPSSLELAEFGLLGEENSTDERIDAFLCRSLGNIDRAPFAAAARRADPRAMDLVCREIRSNASPWPTTASVSATPIMAVNGQEDPETDVERESGGGREHTSFCIPHAGPAPYLDTPSVYNHLLQRFMYRMTRRERQLLASPVLWYGG